MSKQFIEGNVYVFTKKKFLERQNKLKFEKAFNSWAKDINGREVEFNSEYRGEVGMYGVYPEWCKCIKNNN